MLVESKKLNVNCEVCGLNQYSESDSGFYVCITCGTLSQIRFGLTMDFADIARGGNNYKRKKGVEDDYDDDDSCIEDNNETNINTNFNTCTNSEYNDSAYAGGKSKGVKVPKKTLNEILLEHQKIFLNIFRAIYFFYYDYDEEQFSNLFKIAKIYWFNFIKNEYDLQTKRSKSIFNNVKRKLVRSRTNTIDDLNKKGRIVEHLHQYNNPNHQRQRKKSINEQLKVRRVKPNNIANIKDYTGTVSDKKSKLKRFIEEYDEVINYIRSEEMLTLFAQNGLEIENNISLSTLIKICEVLEIQMEGKLTYEEIVHCIFVNKSLNYLTAHCVNFDETKSSLTSENILLLISNIFHEIEQKLQIGQRNPMLFKHITQFYKMFEISNGVFSIEELKILKSFNRDKLLKLLNANDKSDNNRLERINYLLQHLCANLLNLPKTIWEFSLHIYTKIQKRIERELKQKYNLEQFALGLIIYSLKVFYGLNELPYLVILSQNRKEIPNCFELCNLFESKLLYDRIGSLYKELPSLLNIISTLNDKSTQEDNCLSLNEGKEHKRCKTVEYKEKFIKFELEAVYSHISNTFTMKNINELETKLKKIHIQEDTHRDKPNVKFSNKFLMKQKRIRNSNEVHPFLKEEMDFYKSIENSKKKNFTLPFPCDTYLRYEKKAMKFDDVSSPLSEIYVMYLFSKYFKTEYRVLRKVVKIIEIAIESITNKN